MNLRNSGEMSSSKSPKYIKLTQEANETFYQLYEMQLDFKQRYYLEIEDETKYLRVVINENMTSTNEIFNTFEFKNEQITSEFEIPEVTSFPSVNTVLTGANTAPTKPDPSPLKNPPTPPFCDC